MNRLATLSLALVSLAAAPAFADRYLVISSRQDALPPGLRAKLEASGATVRHDLGAIGVLAVEASSADFETKASRLPGVRSVVRDLRLPFTDAAETQGFQSDLSTGPEASAASGALPTEDRLVLQWGYHAVRAGEAYAAGITGRGVRIAVLDNGAVVTNADLAPNVNLELSRSFVPGPTPGSLEPISPPPITGLRFHHGTYSAGLIAGAANGVGIVGIAPAAELVIVKVLHHEGEDGGADGSFGDILAGMTYAGTIGAQVVNMSLAGTFTRSAGCHEDVCWTAREIAEQWTAMARAASLIRRNGGLLVASAGNEGIDFGHAADLVTMPAMLPHVVAVSATTPHGRAFDPATNLDLPAPYSNVGQRLVTLSAPGGYAWPEILALGTSCQRVTAAGRVATCYNMDRVLSLQQNGFGYADGTSASAAHVSGVAALIVEAAGAGITPEQVEARLREWADDLGKPGHDALFGHGRVNASPLAAP